MRARDGVRSRELARIRPGGALGQVPERVAPTATTSMICGYCSTGCSLEVHLRDGRAVNLTPDPSHPVNAGAACPKGWEALTPMQAPDRLTTPLLRDERGKFGPVDWDTALGVVVERFKALQTDHGEESVAFISTGQIPTEEMALLGALFKFGMGFRHGDGNTRQCMATSVVAYKQAFGFDAPPYTYADFEESDVVVLVGSNLAVAHPIMWQRLMANPHDPTVVVVDPRRTETARAADLHLALTPKSDLVLLYGLARRLLELDAVDAGFVADHTTGFDEFVAHVEPYELDQVAVRTGLAVDDVDRAARAVAGGERVSFWWTMGVNQSHEGVRTAQAIIDLALMTGNIGRPGTGANSITGQCNAMGSRLFSNTTSLFAGRDFTSLDDRVATADLLGIDVERIPDAPSKSYDQILEGIATGSTRALWVIATNTAHSWINQTECRELLGRLDFLVVQDLYADTETAAHLVALAHADGPTKGDLPASVRAVARRLEGAFTLVVTHADEPERIVAARRNSPLVLGIGEGETFLASDVAAFIEFTRDAVELGQDQVVTITRDGYDVTDFHGEPVGVNPFEVTWDLAAAEKGGHDYFMLKEIEEQPTAIADTLRGHLVEGRIVLDEQRLTDQDLRDVDKVFVVACGTAYHSGLLAKYAIEHWTRIPVEIELASEFRYRDPVLDRSTLVVAISQSGETADTLEALRHAKEQKARVLAICNTNGAQIPRESDAVIYTHAGPEIGVAATKTFTAQVAANYLIGLALAQARGTKYPDEVVREYEALEAIPAAVAEGLQHLGEARALGQELAPSKAVLFLGRHVGYPVALEGALKLKELAYMHAEAFAAGELKHGPIALIEDGLPVVVVMPSPKGRAVLHSKLLSNIQEIKARGARTVVLAETGDETVRPFADHLFELPAVPTLLQPLVATIPLQVIAAEIARARGYDVDKPRNLAKSVTVE